mmetsp:Transcript_16430/g.48935  ORF Transcript_16430/g.48935 Transcript_16430/m.48935 type:complete len:196 (-) Transcript_16430:52-639(-)
MRAHMPAASASWWRAPEDVCCWSCVARARRSVYVLIGGVRTSVCAAAAQCLHERLGLCALACSYRHARVGVHGLACAHQHVRIGMHVSACAGLLLLSPTVPIGGSLRRVCMLVCMSVGMLGGTAAETPAAVKRQCCTPNLPVEHVERAAWCMHMHMRRSLQMGTIDPNIWWVVTGVGCGGKRPAGQGRCCASLCG